MNCGCREAMCPHVEMPEESINELIRMTRKSRLDGMAMKFTVFKNADIERLNHHSKVALGHVAEEIHDMRLEQGKKNNFYLVINTDEPYADEVVDILKKHGHWG